MDNEKDLSLGTEEITEDTAENISENTTQADETVKAEESAESAESAETTETDKTDSQKSEPVKKKKDKGSLKAFFKSRKAKRGGLSILLSIIFIAVIVGLNFAASLLVEKVPVLSLDLTANSSYELQPETIEYLKNLEDPVTIYVLASESDFEGQGDYYVQANKLLKKFQQYTDKITIKYVDLTSQPTFTSKYTNYDWSSSSYLLLCESGDQYRALSATDLFDYNQEQAYYYGTYTPEGQHVEQAVITAILNITTKEKVKATILSGHDEADASGIKTLLENNAFEVEEVSLLNKDISDDSQFLIIYAPKVDISDGDLETISAWLNNDDKYGHTVIYMPNDQSDQNHPNIDKLLSDWGMEIGNGLIFETDPSHMTNTNSPYLITIMDYANEEYTEDLKTKDIPVVMPYTMPVKITDDSKATALLTSSEKAVIMPFDADENWDYNEETPAQYNGAVISSESSSDSSSNVVVIGAYDALSSSALSSTSFNNASYFVNMLNKLAKRDDIGITIEGKSLDNTAIGVTDSATLVILSIFIRFVIPAVILVIGLVVWLRRRNK